VALLDFVVSLLLLAFYCGGWGDDDRREEWGQRPPKDSVKEHLRCDDLKVNEDGCVGDGLIGTADADSVRVALRWVLN